MAGFDPRKSLALWRARERFRKERHTVADKAGDVARRDKWKRLLFEARAMVARRERQVDAPPPPFKTAGQIGLSFTYVFGSKGKVVRGGGHYSATGRAAGMDDLVRMARQFHEHHKSLGWGGLSYEVLIADDGSMVFGNPVDRKAAAIASMNTGMVSICCPGTTGDRLTNAQQQSIRWLMDHWHTDKVPARHRLPVRARSIPWRGHREWNNNSACPGAMLPDFHEAWS